MAGAPLPVPRERRTYRTRVVIVSGTVDAAFGLALLLIGAIEGALTTSSNDRALWACVGAFGLVVGGSGVSRLLARLEIHDTKLIWTWAFITHEHPLSDLTEADLVERGSPKPGASWAGFLGGGLLGVATIFLIDLWSGMFEAGPTLGSRSLIVQRKFGSPLEIRAIGTFAAENHISEASTAQIAVQNAIETFHRHPAQNTTTVERHSVPTSFPFDSPGSDDRY